MFDAFAEPDWRPEPHEPADVFLAFWLSVFGLMTMAVLATLALPWLFVSWLLFGTMVLP